MQSVLKNHRKTWLLWINQLSPISPNISNVSLGDREALAEALAIAAPSGPAGIQCVDECECQNNVPARASLELWNELSKRGFADNLPPDEAVTRMRQALVIDYVSTMTRDVRFPAKHLADLNVIVSQNNGDVAHARRLFPRTYEIIERMRR